jgi:hypothetical protein
MRRRSAPTAPPGAGWLPAGIALGLLLLAAPAPGAAELPVRTLLAAQQDLQQVAVSPDGSVLVQRDRDLLDLSGGGSARDLVALQSDQTLHLAPNGRQYGLATHREGAADLAPAAAFELRDAAGGVLWRLGATEDVAFALSGFDQAVGMTLNVNQPEAGRLRFYGAGGELLAEQALPGLLSGAFDTQGQRFFAISVTHGLQVFDASGAWLWELPGVRMYATVPGGERVLAVAGDRLFLLDDGRTTATAELSGLLVRRMALAADGSRAAVADRNEIRVYDGATLAPLWDRRLEEASLALTSLDLASAGGWLLAGVARDLGAGAAAEARHPAGDVRLYDAGGVQRHQISLTFSAWNIFTPTARIDASGETATITTRRAVYRTTLP